MNRVFQPNRTNLAFVGMNSPWGQVDHVTHISAGIWSVSTPGHGGIYLDESHNARVPGYMRVNDGWYEEDCDWCIPFCVFEEQIKSDCRDDYTRSKLPENHHWKTLKDWHPQAYERFTGKKLQPGESHMRDEETWREAHKGDLQVVSAFGDWHANVPEGMVGVMACVGGRDERGGYNGPLRQFLVTEAEYRTRLDNPCGTFVVDPSRHQEFPFHNQ